MHQNYDPNQQYQFQNQQQYSNTNAQQYQPFSPQQQQQQIPQQVPSQPVLPQPVAQQTYQQYIPPQPTQQYQLAYSKSQPQGPPPMEGSLNQSQQSQNQPHQQHMTYISYQQQQPPQQPPPQHQQQQQQNQSQIYTQAYQQPAPYLPPPLPQQIQQQAQIRTPQYQYTPQPITTTSSTPSSTSSSQEAVAPVPSSSQTNIYSYAQPQGQYISSFQQPQTQNPSFVLPPPSQAYPQQTQYAIQTSSVPRLQQPQTQQFQYSDGSLQSPIGPGSTALDTAVTTMVSVPSLGSTQPPVMTQQTSIDPMMQQQQHQNIQAPLQTHIPTPMAVTIPATSTIPAPMSSIPPQAQGTPQVSVSPLAPVQMQMTAPIQSSIQTSVQTPIQTPLAAPISTTVPLLPPSIPASLPGPSSIPTPTPLPPAKSMRSSSKRQAHNHPDKHYSQDSHFRGSGSSITPFGSNTLIKTSNYRFSLEVAQQPIRARMCGFGDKDRRQITPPPCVRLRVYSAQTGQEITDFMSIDISHFALIVELWSVDMNTNMSLVHPSGQIYNPNRGPSHGRTASIHHQQQEQYQYYQQPQHHPQQPQQQLQQQLQTTTQYYAQQQGAQIVPPVPSVSTTIGPQVSMVSASAAPHTRNLIGTLVATGNKLHDLNDNAGIWFILQDLSVRTEGEFRLKFSFVNLADALTSIMNSAVLDQGDLHNQIDKNLDSHSAPIITTIFSEPFRSYSAKKFPGVIDSTDLSRCFATQGIKIPIRREHRPKEKRINELNTN